MGNGQQSKSYASKGKAVKVAKNIPPAAPSTAPAAPSTAPAAPSTANGVQKELLKDLAAPKGRRFNFRNKNMGNNWHYDFLDLFSHAGSRASINDDKTSNYSAETISAKVSADFSGRNKSAAISTEKVTVTPPPNGKSKKKSTEIILYVIFL